MQSLWCLFERPMHRTTDLHSVQSANFSNLSFCLSTDHQLWSLSGRTNVSHCLCSSWAGFNSLSRRSISRYFPQVITCAALYKNLRWPTARTTAEIAIKSRVALPLQNSFRFTIIMKCLWIRTGLQKEPAQIYVNLATEFTLSQKISTLNVTCCSAMMQSDSRSMHRASRKHLSNNRHICTPTAQLIVVHSVLRDT